MIRLLELEVRRKNFSRDIDILRRVLSKETYRSVGHDYQIGPERTRMIVNTLVRRICRYKNITNEWPDVKSKREDAGLVDLLDEFVGQVYAIRRGH